MDLSVVYVKRMETKVRNSKMEEKALYRLKYHIDFYYDQCVIQIYLLLY